MSRARHAPAAGRTGEDSGGQRRTAEDGEERRLRGHTGRPRPLPAAGATVSPLTHECSRHLAFTAFPQTRRRIWGIIRIAHAVLIAGEAIFDVG